MMGEAYIVSAVRTAGGRKGGRLRDWHPVDLAGAVLDELVARSGVDPALVEDVIMGCVSQGGEQSNSVGRNAVLASKLPESVPAVTIDRQCGSSQQALHFAAQAVMSGTMDMVMAAGVESMTRVPMGSPTVLSLKAGMGGSTSPGMEARYPGVVWSQFNAAQMIADKHGFSREDMDRFALESHMKAARAIEAGVFKAEILALNGVDKEGHAVIHDTDEGVRATATYEGIAGLQPLMEGGAITAGNASQMCDGAAGLLVVNERGLKQLGVEPLARVHQMTVYGEDPVIMLEAPLNATKLALKRTGLSINDIDLYEVNEAFASIPMAWLKALDADPAKLNVHGGAIALGHPLGGTGAKLMTTLIHALRSQGKKYGLQTMCEGGGLANVTIIEAL
ncbi:acetyl-CoA C-acetyltransferase [Brevundimonas terrae]|uniref:Acetyl-CoA C-acetyltransferase n=2 Tax=Brevundimonas terrae TaxID=363631 RepID=A0ABN0Y6F7_9CAUL|nr:acetyl-CoA C-acetyltransferase [Brevundimonas terrae]NIJ25470.1 acetyl-CoA C-acetyltransferase [Brevundimonas terrae]